MIPNILTDKDLMPYGKWMGHKMANVPADYLLWLYDNDKCNAPVKKYVEDNKGFLELQSKTDKKLRSK